MTLIYRVENDNLEGPYSGVKIDWGMVAVHDDDYDNHPGPARDKGLNNEVRWGIDKNESCGFQSREQLDEWFAGFQESLDRLGFHVSVYSAPNARHGDRQSVFVRDTATKLSEEKL